MKFEDELVKKNFTFKSVIEAREKQIEKETKVYNDKYFDLFNCPNCKEIYDAYDDDFKYCCKCGQKLKVDWSEADE